MLATRENIETLLLNAIINKKEQYQELLQTFNVEHFSNKTLKSLFEHIKTSFSHGQASEPELFLIKQGVQTESIKKLFDIENVYSSQELKKFMITIFQQKELEKLKTIDPMNIEDSYHKIKEIETKLSMKACNSIKNAQVVIDEYRNKLTEAQEAYENRGGIVGISTGIPSLNDKIMGFCGSEYIVVAARPSMGKTALSTGFFIEAIKNTDIPGVPVMFSLEMPSEQIMGRIVACENEHLDLKQTIFGKDRIEANGKINDVLNGLGTKEFFIEDFSNEEGNRQLTITPLDLREKLNQIKAIHGKISLIIIDYLQLLSPSNPRLIDINARTAAISAEVKALARTFGCPVIALSQLNRDLEKRQDKRPQMSDLRDSGAIEQDADKIIFVYRPKVYLEKEIKERLSKKGHDPVLLRQLELLNSRSFSEAELIIGKQRNGPIGIVNTYYHDKNTKFGDIDMSEENAELNEIFGNKEIYE